MFSLTISGWELKYSGYGFWRQQFQHLDRTLQHCFLFSPFIPTNDGSLCSTQPYLQLLQLCCCWTGFWDNFFFASSKHVVSLEGACDSHSRGWYPSPCEWRIGAHPLPFLRGCVNFPFFKYLLILFIWEAWIDFQITAL